jgi:isopenicillin-N epimerase
MSTDALTLPLPDLAGHFMLRPGITFLNHGSFGACPRPVFDVYQDWQRELEAQPVEFLGRRLNGLLAEARGRLADYVGTQADNLAFVPNATHGINIVARSLDLQPGDEVLGTDQEYGAVERTWRFNCEPHGARYISRPLELPARDAAEMVEQLWAGVTERTRVILVSHISSPTALIFPIAEICRRARAAGILTVVDGAHAPGQIDLDMEAIGADFYSGNCHKWLCAPKGAGFLYARPELQPQLKPLIVSWGWQAERPGPSPFVDYFEWIGTMDPSAYLSVPAAIDFQARNNWPAVRAACHELLLEASRQLTDLTGLEPFSPDSTDWWVQMRTLPLPPCDVEQVKARLWDEYRVEVPLVQWRARQYVRLSIQAYNTPNDIDRLMEGLRRILPAARLRSR